jgi:hypothetical protein
LRDRIAHTLGREVVLITQFTPKQLVARDAVSLTAFLPEPGEYVVRVRWSRYWTLSDGCVRPTEDGWSMIVVERSGTAKIEGGLAPRHCWSSHSA